MEVGWSAEGNGSGWQSCWSGKSKGRLANSSSALALLLALLIAVKLLVGKQASLEAGQAAKFGSKPLALNVGNPRQILGVFN
jgi:hypothetical protein